MNEQKIEPPKITKPIQLLAAWLVGLVLINGSFLAAATALSSIVWAQALLVIASVINVPIFLICIFILQTRFRPEMQEDIYYSKYLELNTGKYITTSSTDNLLKQLQNELIENQQQNLKLILSIMDTLKSVKINTLPIQRKLLSPSTEKIKAMNNRIISFRNYSIEVNDLLPEYKDIRHELTKHQISINDTFGSTSEIPEVPKYKIITFGKTIPIELLREIILICKNFGFDQIHYSNQEMNLGRIYIGSYIYRANERPLPVKITDNIIKIINDKDSDLNDVIEAIETTK